VSAPGSLAVLGLAAAVAGLAMMVGCAKPPAPAPAPAAPPAPKENVIVLLPDSGSPSQIVVSNAAGSRELAQPYTAVTVERSDTAPSAPYTMDEGEVRRRFGDTLSSMPTPAVYFTLYFDEASDTLTAEAKATVEEVIRVARLRRSTSVSVTGHTDTTDAAASNYELGLKRAKTVAGILQSAGLSAESLFIASHGETDLLIKTADGVDEPRNRRVEVVVR
jgi:outer membrane protein OmpA-like peptidoglycan-associated protein